MADRWSLSETLQERLRDEVGTLARESDLPVALCYPSPYHVGMSSLGFQTLYREIHLHPGCSAERIFLPDDVDVWRRARMPLCSYELSRPMASFPILAVSVSYELEVAGVLELLDLAGLPLLSAERSDRDPLVVAGGPLTFSNPLPLAPFVDVLVLGEGEELIHTLLDHVQGTPDRQRLLQQLARLPGFHVPSIGGALGAVARAEDERLPAHSQIVTPHTELRSMFLVEPERGCSRGCTYCVMRRTTNGGMRTVPPERVLGLVPPGTRKVGLVGAAVTDHPRLPELLAALIEGGIHVGVSSLRADRLDAELVGLLAKAGGRSITTALDGASERLRLALDRKTSEAQVANVARLTREQGLTHLKLYVMLGIPGETEADLDELIRLGTELSRIVPIVFGVSPFVAKRNTPMDGVPFEPIASLDRKLDRLRRGLAGRVDVRSSSPRWAWVEHQLAQSGPEGGLAAMDAWRAGGGFAAWKRAFRERGVRPHEARRVADGRLRLPTLSQWPSVGA